jgi:dihydroflavonol-4-reductase
MRVLAAITEDVCGVLKIPPPLYRRRLDFYTVDVQYDIRKSRDLLQWTPQIGLDAGLRLSAEWYRQQGLL